MLTPNWARGPLGGTGAAARGARHNEPAKQLRFALDYPYEK
jgi:RES domain-containing protein